MKFHLVVLSLFAVACFGLACDGKNAATGSKFQTVFGTDDRVLSESPNAYPWTAIGRLEMPDGSWCTGSLVWHNLVLTNAHCVEDSSSASSNEIKPLTFKTGLVRDSAISEATAIDVWKGTVAPDSDSEDDFALLVLDQSIGGNNQWFDVVADRVFPVIDPATTVPLNGGYSVMGYAADIGGGKIPSLQRNCSIAGEEKGNGYLLHDCDTYAGSSGAPIFDTDAQGRARIVGINESEKLQTDGREVVDGSAFSPALGNIAVKAQRFASVLAQLKNAYPSAVHDTSAKWNVKICNDTSNTDVYVSLAYKESRIAAQLTANGWWKVTKGECRMVNVAAVAPIYGVAGPHVHSLGETTIWPSQRDKLFCINGNDAYANDSDRPCRENENAWYRQYFGQLPQTGVNGTIVWTLTD